MLNDYYLFNIGKNFNSYRSLGAHPLASVDGEGYRFATWAPKAQYVSVVGDFNNWDTSAHPMALQEDNGIWLTSVENAKVGMCYKYFIVGADGESRYKADPFAFKTELRPSEASVLYHLEAFSWEDEDFIERRSLLDRNNSPMNVYELHISSWKRKEDGSLYNFREIAPLLAEYVKDMGYTHVELMPITEYPFDGSWGYQVSGYFSPTRRHGDREDFQYFVNYMHKKNIGVLLDWVPAHFPRDAFALAYYDGSPCFEYADSRIGEHQEWGTLVFDYARSEVRSFLFSSALYWIEECHVDGIRVDAVSAMIYRNYGRDEYLPNQDGGKENYEAISFLTELNDYIHDKFPGVLSIAEESTSWPKVTHPSEEGGLAFDMKWDMGWMHDTLEYFSLDYVYRSYHHNKITFSMLYNFHERFLLAISHDEVVHGKKSLISKMPGDFWRQFASLRAFFIYMMGHPGGKLMFMGSEFGQFIEWRFYEELEWFLLDYDMHKKLHNFVRTLNHFYLDIPAFWQDDKSWEGFNWLNADDHQNSVYSWARKDKSGNYLIFIMNMTPTPLDNYKIPAPVHGKYRVLLNSDAKHWGGSDYQISIAQGNEHIAEENLDIENLYTWEESTHNEDEDNLDKTEDIIFSSRKINKKDYPQSIRMNLPPLAAMILQLEEVIEDTGESWPDPEFPYPEKWQNN